jgi:hypothetical protein
MLLHVCTRLKVATLMVELRDPKCMFQLLVRQSHSQFTNRTVQ